MITRKTLALTVLLTSCIPFFLHANNGLSHIEKENHFTTVALGVLEEAKNSIDSKNYQNGAILAKKGTQYDEHIADFYFIQAISEAELKGKNLNVLSLLEKSLEKNKTWYMYLEDEARLYLVNCYTCVKRYNDANNVYRGIKNKQSANAILTEVKLLYSSAKIDLARDVVLAGSKQYPLDSRFDEYFFLGEKMTSGKVSNANNMHFDYFIERAKRFIAENPYLHLYATYFSKDAKEKNILLKSWNALEIKDPLYAILALKEDLLTEKEAYDYIKDFFPNIQFHILKSFLQCIHTEEVKADIKTYFSQYNGQIIFDTNNDLFAEMIAEYRYGRPYTIHYDENQDGLRNFSVISDNGIPKSVYFYKEETSLSYSTWPFIQKVHTIKNDATFNLVENTLSLPVLKLTEDKDFAHCGLSFFIPQLDSNSVLFSEQDLFNAAFSISLLTEEYESSRCKLTLLDGRAKKATFTEDGKIYAQANFINGILSSRIVDKDNDGFYEITEHYTKKQSKNPTTLLKDKKFYFEQISSLVELTSIDVDLDKDGSKDFSHNYEIDKTSTSWYFDSIGSYHLTHTKYNDSKTEELLYHHPITKQKHIITIENGIPTLVDSKEIIKDAVLDFYWIGEPIDNIYVQTLLEKASLEKTIMSVNVSKLLWNTEKELFMRIVCIKNGDMYFGEVFYE